jgi:hypothetical protein
METSQGSIKQGDQLLWNDAHVSSFAAVNGEWQMTSSRSMSSRLHLPVLFQNGFKGTIG